MPANTLPIYTLSPNVSTDAATTMSQVITAAAADYTGIGANNRLVHTAGANGSYIRVLVCKALGTNVASVLRVFINNGLTNATAANNTFIDEISLPATTISAVASTVTIRLPLEFGLDPAFRLYVGLGTAVAAGWNVTCLAGEY